MSDQAKPLVQRLRDTAQLRGQFPDWLLREMEHAADEIERLRRGLKRALEWGGLGTPYHAVVRYDLVKWIEAGMIDPLPPMPEHLEEAQG